MGYDMENTGGNYILRDEELKVFSKCKAVGSIKMECKEALGRRVDQPLAMFVAGGKQLESEMVFILSLSWICGCVLEFLPVLDLSFFLWECSIGHVCGVTVSLALEDQSSDWLVP